MVTKLTSHILLWIVFFTGHEFPLIYLIQFLLRNKLSIPFVAFSGFFLVLFSSFLIFMTSTTGHLKEGQGHYLRSNCDLHIVLICQCSH